MSKRIKTNKIGVYYRESITDGKADKTYYITYKDEFNKTKELKVGKYSEGIREVYCQKKRNEIITKIRLGEDSPQIGRTRRKIILLDSIMEPYFETRKNIKSTKSDTLTYNKHLAPFFKDKDFELITKNDIRKLQKILKATKYRGEYLSVKTINNIWTLFTSIVNYGLREELIKNDPIKFIEKEKVDNVRERFLSKEEINVLYEYLEDNPSLYLFSKLALTTGARLSTILNISKKDIDFSNQIISLKDFKNNTTYKSFLTEEIVNLLFEWCEELEVNDKIFYRPGGIQKQMLTILNDLFNKKIKVSDRKNRVVLHSLRHTFASHLAINGTPIYTIQKLMNHKDINMTMRYAKLAPDSGKDAIINLGF